MNDNKPALYLARYGTPGECLHAAEKLRDGGYKNFDAHTPFPVHGMDAAMGMGDSKLGWIVFPAGLTGSSLAFLMIWWMNGVDYPLIIGGKPPFSIPSMIPVVFELTVLLSCFAIVLGMFGLNKIPRHHHPIFNSKHFESFSDDKFFISVEVDDPKFHLERTRKLLDATNPELVELVHDDDDNAPVTQGEAA
jgi:Protein of unknown function (DUF3341)